MIVDGRALADILYLELAKRRAQIPDEIRLGIIVCGSDAATESFVRIKTKRAKQLGITIDRVDLDANADTDALISTIEKLVRHNHGVVVQLPLPSSIDTGRVLAAIPTDKDVDALNPEILDDMRLVHAPVALAVREILERNGINPEGKKAIVVGEGRLVGAPVAYMLKERGANVSIVTLGSGSLEDLKDADIIVSGAGSPGLIKPHHLKSGVVLIDAGTSELAGAVVGDADPACAEVASLFTPVPGGVGPVAVAILFRNLLDLVQKAE